jgi:hypothetical protein
MSEKIKISFPPLGHYAGNFMSANLCGMDI